jgi:predicted  nucleic acid-binding Zn-ribbon protein
MSNRKKNDESVKVTSMALWVVAAIFAGIVGLRYVYLTNQIHATGRQIHDLEIELKDIDAQTRVANSQISKLTSHTELNRRLSEGFIRMVKITDDRVVHIASKQSATPQDEVRPVANKGDVR